MAWATGKENPNGSGMEISTRAFANTLPDVWAELLVGAKARRAAINSAMAVFLIYMFMIIFLIQFVVDSSYFANAVRVRVVFASGGLRWMREQ
jgi:hypothetical protein